MTSVSDSDAEAQDDDSPAQSEPAGGGPTDEDTGRPADEGPLGRMTWPRAIVLALAVGFLGFALALFLGRDRPVSSSSVDVGFYQDMIYLNDQALQVAFVAAESGAHGTSDVLIGQSMEIGVMQRSLEEWGISSYDRPEEALAWMGTPTPVDEMPGLPTEAQMEELADVQGHEAHALFLEMIVEHHRAGIHMAEYAVEHAERDDVREMANRMAVNLAQEINVYAYLAERMELPVEIDQVPVPEGEGAEGDDADR